ncbi:MAG: MarR family transcriptional regulator [Sphingomonas sp.]
MNDTGPEPSIWDESGFERLATHYHDFYPAETREDLEFRLTRRLILVSRWWTTLIDEAIKRETGQSRARWQTLFVIAFSGESTTTMMLSERLGVQWPSLVRMLNQLEADGLITRDENPDDRRSRLISLTSEGRQVIRKVKPVLDRTRHGVLEHVSDDDLRKTIALLGAIPDASGNKL